MGGIAGVLNLGQAPVPPSLVRAMTGRIAHRGPDAEDCWTGDNVGLGMCRLTLSAEQTGCRIAASEDGQVVAALAGGIYNADELRDALRARGHVLENTFDTDLLPHLYEEYGDAFPERLNGIFAIAVWDRARRRLVLVRDRVGIQPLYYARTNGRVVFGSELKALVAAGIDRTVSKEAVYHYLTFSFLPAPLAIYENVLKLLPAHVAVCTDRGVEAKCYWQLDPAAQTGRSEDEWIEELDDLLADSVRRRLGGDVQPGSFLSGGVDSSTVAELMSRVCDRPLKTFTGGHPTARSESPVAERVSRCIGAEHHVSTLTPPLVVENLERIVAQFDEPFADFSAIPIHFVSRLARREGVNFVLTGDGADTHFAGHFRFLRYFRWRPVFYVPGVLRRTIGRLERLFAEDSRAKRHLRDISLDPMRAYVTGNVTLSNYDLLDEQFLPASAGVDSMDVAGPFIRRDYPTDLDTISACNLKLGATKVITKVDRVCASASLGVRMPLLDHRVIEFAFRLPRRLRLRGKMTKYLLKRRLARRLPAEIVYRRKQGFAIPLGDWLRNELRALLTDHLTDRAIRRVGFFRAEKVKEMMDAHMTGRRNCVKHLWQVLMGQLWAERCLASPPGEVEVQEQCKRNDS